MRYLRDSLSVFFFAVQFHYFFTLAFYSVFVTFSSETLSHFANYQLALSNYFFVRPIISNQIGTWCAHCCAPVQIIGMVWLLGAHRFIGLIASNAFYSVIKVEWKSVCAAQHTHFIVFSLSLSLPRSYSIFVQTDELICVVVVFDFYSFVHSFILFGCSFRLAATENLYAVISACYTKLSAEKRHLIYKCVMHWAKRLNNWLKHIYLFPNVIRHSRDICLPFRWSMHQWKITLNGNLTVNVFWYIRCNCNKNQLMTFFRYRFTCTHRKTFVRARMR